MSIQTAFLVLILGVLASATALLLFYELGALAFKQWFTISTYWDRFARRRRWLMIGMGMALTTLYVFLLGDLSLEWW